MGLVTRERYWLDDRGTRLEVGVGGLLIGRSGECDIVIQAPDVSRHHALVRLTTQGPEVLCMGRQPVAINDRDAASTALLGDGDRVRVGDREFVVLRLQETAAAPHSTWVIERGEGRLFGITQSELLVGGGTGDDLIIDGWPAGALCIHLVQDAPVIEARVGDLRAAGQPLAIGALITAKHGDEIALAGESLRLIALAHGGAKTTATSARAPLPGDVRLQFLPRGGRLFLRFEDRDEAVIYLAERRCALIASLLEHPGELVPDDHLCTQVWPRDPNKDRLALNTLVFRVRNDLVKAGLNGVELVERDAGCTRFRVRADAHVRID